MPSAKLFVIDAHALCYRSFYAIRELSTSKGQATNAVFGFVNTLKKILKEHKPDYMAICFDSKEKTHRQKKFAEYKIQRPSMPDDLISQMPYIKEVVKGFNLAAFELAGYEADDMIATLVSQLSKKNLDVVIVSDDKDMFQLVNEKVKVFSARKDQLFDHKALKKRLGFEPHQIIDFIGLAGDSADNIPGVKGIGEITAKELLNQYGSLENILEHVDEIKKSSLQDKLREQKESALLSKELAILETKAPVECDLDKLKVRDPNRNHLFEIFKELEFKRLAEEFSTKQREKQVEDLKFLKTEAEIQSAIKLIQKNGAFTCLLDSGNEKDSQVINGVVFCVEEGKTFYSSSKNLDALEEIFQDPKITKITFNLKNILKLFPRQAQAILQNSFDCMLAAHLVGAWQPSSGLNDLAWKYFEEGVDLKDSIGDQASLVRRLHLVLAKELKEKALNKLFEEIETPLAYVLSKMETEGVKLDSSLLKKLSKNCDQKINALTVQVYKQSGEEFNLNSPKQLSHILFEKLKLPVIKKTKTGFSTNEEVLIKLSTKHEVPSLILEYRQVAKLKSTYIDALPKLVDSKTGRIHAEFDQIGAETGRLSSRHPNLQNIPIRTELGKQIRKAIVATQENSILISADYSQIELRILAHLTQDQNLREAFEQDQDIHCITASKIFDVSQNDVTEQMRDSAKRVNFGIIYGMSAFGLAKDLSISQAEAQEFIDKYFLRYPSVQKFMTKTIKQCEEDGYVLTILNRRRYISEINSKNMAMKQFAQRQAINTPVQGSAADLIKLAMINVQKELEDRKLKSKLIITVHDELVFEGPKEEKQQMVQVIHDVMEAPLKLSVPLKISVKAGKNWLDMQEVTRN